MRKTLTFILILSIIGLVKGQSNFPKQTHHAHKKKLLDLLEPGRNQAKKITPIRHVLENDFIKMDSFKLLILDENSTPGNLTTDFKVEIEYDEFGHHSSSTQYESNNDGSLEKDDYFEKIYDDKGRLKEYIEYDVSNNPAIPSDKSIYSYYENNLLKEESFWQWNGSTWDSLGRENFAYDESGRVIEENYSFIHFGSDNKTQITYSDTLISSIYSVFDEASSTYQPTTKNETRIYVDKEITIFYRIFNDGTWKIKGKEEKSFLNNEKNTTIINYIYNETNIDPWLVTDKIVTELNSFNKISSYLLENYSTNGSVEYGYFETYSYSDNGVLLTVTYYDFDSNLKDYVPEAREVLISDTSITREKMLVPFEENDEESARYLEYKLDTLKRYDYDAVENDWFIDEVGVFYYSSFAPSVAHDQQYKNIKVFPNPARDYVHFNADKGEIKFLKLFDVNGILKSSMNGNIESIDVSNLKEGIYIYTIQLMTNEILKGKIMVSK